MKPRVFFDQRVWFVPVVLPLMLLAFSFVCLSWSWGLMDDLTLLSVSGGWWERVRFIFQMYHDFGEMKWTHALHCATFYQLFAWNPSGFYIFKWAEVLLMLVVWGSLAWILTGRQIALLLFMSVALSFHYLYDQFFFLSTHETTGLLFLGLALWVFMMTEMRDPESFWRKITGVVTGLGLILSLGAKEPFVTGVFSAGIGMAWLGWHDKGKRGLVWVGALWVLAAIGYGLYLKLGVSKGYTAGYSFTDFSRMILNLLVWVKKVFLNHVPWIMACLGVMCWTGGVFRWREFSVQERFGLVLTGVLYSSFLGVFLPWNLAAYYMGPLGVFFALGVALLLARRIDYLAPMKHVLLVFFAASFSFFMVCYTLHREAVYNQNTQALWSWVRADHDFQQAGQQGRVFCNAMEASVALPGHANRWWDLGLKRFTYISGVAQAGTIASGYFVYCPRFGRLGGGLGAGWEKVFDSRYWQVYRKK